jgi:hypothetical protein
MGTTRFEALPMDKNNHWSGEMPTAVSALAVRTINGITSGNATSIDLKANTTYLEVSAYYNGVFMRYGTSATSTKYDEFIPAGQYFPTTRRYALNNVTMASATISFQADKSVVTSPWIRIIQK